MSPQARQRTLAAIGHFIAEQGQSEPDGDVAAAAADAAAKAATPPPPQAPEPSKEIASNPARSNLAKPPSATPAAAAKAVRPCTSAAWLLGATIHHVRAVCRTLPGFSTLARDRSTAC